MMIDCGILTDDPKYWRGWHGEVPHDLLVLVHTPGIPHEWIHAALKLSDGFRRKLRDHLETLTPHQITHLEWHGEQNATTIDADDGLRMLVAVCPGYAGPAPLYSSLALQAAPESDQKIADLLGVDRQKVRRWRTNHVFDPLTGIRLINPRGRPAGRKSS